MRAPPSQEVPRAAPVHLVLIPVEQSSVFAGQVQLYVPSSVACTPAAGGLHSGLPSNTTGQQHLTLFQAVNEGGR